MASKPPTLEGVHFVRHELSSGRTRWYVYAWRGGPKIMTAGTILKPALTPEAVAAFTKAHEGKAVKARADTFASLVEAYLGSPEFRSRAASTKRDYRRWCESAKDRFGTAKLRAFADPRIRGDIIAWRDQWAHAPRAAHYAMQVLSRVFSWGVERGWLTSNPTEAIASSYSADRAEVVWEDAEIEAVAAKMKPHVARAFKLAAWTGLARGDLIALRWNEVGDLYISRRRSKTKVEQVIPLFDETRALLKQFPKRALTVVTSARGEAFTARGFAMAVERARDAAGVASGKTLHDVRGTFATRLMRAGFADGEIDEILGWETGKSSRIRRRYISRTAVVISAIERMRKRSKY
jgi:integrase